MCVCLCVGGGVGITGATKNKQTNIQNLKGYVINLHDADLEKIQREKMPTLIIIVTIRPCNFQGIKNMYILLKNN